MKQSVCGSCRLIHPDGMDCQEAKDEHLRLLMAADRVRRAQRAAAQARWRGKNNNA